MKYSVVFILLFTFNYHPFSFSDPKKTPDFLKIAIDKNTEEDVKANEKLKELDKTDKETLLKLEELNKTIDKMDDNEILKLAITGGTPLVALLIGILSLRSAVKNHNDLLRSNMQLKAEDYRKELNLKNKQVRIDQIRENTSLFISNYLTYFSKETQNSREKLLYLIPHTMALLKFEGNELVLRNCINKAQQFIFEKEPNELLTLVKRDAINTNVAEIMEILNAIVLEHQKFIES